ncbi:hypothetical protein [Paenibacillus sinopodophylli]|uniref:hypothetical protein n=1 Tax=Paenibacillus sinopodophylli TaxID=1837342 RepID=UPI00110CCE00|nr:hypothetical protein [Paenibacillus sinopodophylli]
MSKGLKRLNWITTILLLAMVLWGMWNNLQEAKSNQRYGELVKQRGEINQQYGELVDQMAANNKKSAQELQELRDRFKEYVDRLDGR